MQLDFNEISFFLVHEISMDTPFDVPDKVILLF